MTLIVLACVVVLFILLGWVVDAWTDYLWFSEVKYTQVFTTVLQTRLGLFAIFGFGMALIVWFNLWLAFRLRPMLRMHSSEQQSLERYRGMISPRFGLWSGLLSAIVGLFGGLSAQGRWQQWLLFSNGQSFGVKDPQFGVDLGFYVFAYPFWRYLLGVGFTLVVLCVLGALAMHYLFGGVRLQGAGERMTVAARAHLTALVAFFVLLKAAAYFLDQRGLLLAHNDATNLFGAGYTDINALLPAKEILAWISVVVAIAILVFSNAFIRNLVWPGIAIGLLALSAIAVGGIYPAAVQTFTVKPNIRDKEATYIERSIDATRDAFGLNNIQTIQYPSTANVPPESLMSDTDTVANIRLLDPSIVSNTYTQLQQVRGFYDFTQKLDIDRYTTDGNTQDYVVGVREMDYNNLTPQQSNWQNQHTVFTHGYGFVAAPANQIVCNGQPEFASGFLDNEAAQTNCQSDTDQIPVAQPRIYYGENMNPYAIVGKASNGQDAEYDRPSGSNDQYVTYDGSGGVSVGSYLRRMLYAYKYKETNFLISSVFNKNSKILYVRDPRQRVQKVAPFLTLDGDPYPAVVNGHIVWILDGYTTASTYPYSQEVDLQSATSDTQTGEGTAQQAQTDINYLRNSVKATVDAYTGKVTLYAFGQSDPVLNAWNKAFGGNLIKPSSAIPPELAQHFRYPEDQFKVQRELLTRFHVSDPSQFYSGQDFWQVPQDPAPGTTANQAPYYLLAKFPGQNQTTFQLTSAMTPRGRQNLAALVTGSYVNGQPKLEILQLPPDTQVSGPGQADQKMTNDNSVRPQISLLQNSATVIYGNLLSLPVGSGMLYVEPLYVQSKAENAYPQLKYVLVNFGQYVGFADSLQGALTQLLNSAKSAGANPPAGPPPSASQPPPTSQPNPEVDQATQRIDKAIADLKAAQQSGNFTDYGQALQELNDAITAYQQARDSANVAPSPSPSVKPSTRSSTSPSPKPSVAPSG
ncbi:UPF0182 family protein [Rugosimonospora acidiphila]|uniref:UPF0182 protein GCM10023322_23090 n=2 Tax=Rugosimonospora acidiphila TaxID=556531 RepID=A0ABP9RPJ5_9ACTN